MQTSDVLNKAADLIEQRGWATSNCGMIANHSAPMCLEGALAEASGGVATIEVGPPDDPEFSEDVDVYVYHEVHDLPAYEALEDYLAHLGFRKLYRWNDAQADAAPIIEVLRACAVIESARERESAEVSLAEVR